GRRRRVGGMSILVPLAAGLLTFAAALIVLTTQRRALVRDRMTPYLGSATRMPLRTRIARRRSLAGAADALLDRYNVREPLADSLDRAGHDTSTGRFALVAAAIGATCFVVFLISGGFFLAVIAGLVGLLAPVAG